MKSSYFIQIIGGTTVFFLILFISAGRIDNWQGWIYVIIGLIMGILNFRLFSVI